MKAKLKLISLVGLMAGSLVCLGQDSPASAQPGAAQQPIATSSASATAEPSADAASAETNTLDTNATATAEVTQSADAETESPTAESEGGTNEIIPLIVMDDVGLIDAIKNLARQAGLNYVLDPKVPYGNVGPNGVEVPEPKISIRWEKLTAQQALTALLNNYSLEIVQDPKTSIARITVKQPGAPEPLLTETLQLAFASPSNMVPIIQASFVDKRSRVLSDSRSSQLVVVATEKEMRVVKDLLKSLDKPPKQVLIEAKLIETSTNPKTAKGIDWSDTLSKQNVTFGNGFSSGTFTTTTPGSSAGSVTLPGGRIVSGSSSGSSESSDVTTTVGSGGLSLSTARGLTPDIGFLNADGVHAVLSFINQNNDARVISEPRTVTLDNEEASLSVTRANPIFKNTAGTQGSPGGSEVTYTNLGTILRVTPRISANNYIQLHVIPEVSSVFDTVTRTVAGTVNQADRYDMRKIETRVLIPSGNTLVLGGLMQDSMNHASSKVPLFGDLPLLGRAFRHNSKERAKSNLLIFITPTIIQESDFESTHSTFINASYKDPLLKEKKDTGWSTWDSTTPHDWSKIEHRHSQDAGTMAE